MFFKAIKYTIFVAIFIAIRIKLSPEVVLKVPKIGFLLYHIINGAPIPPYIVQEHWKNDTEWLQGGSVVVSIAVKSGTTWAMVFTFHPFATV